MKIRFASVFVADQAAALAFYTEVLGFVTSKDIPLGTFRFLTVAALYSVYTERMSELYPQVRRLLEESNNGLVLETAEWVAQRLHLDDSSDGKRGTNETKETSGD